MLSSIETSFSSRRIHSSNRIPMRQRDGRLDALERRVEDLNRELRGMRDAAALAASVDGQRNGAPPVPAQHSDDDDEGWLP